MKKNVTMQVDAKKPITPTLKKMKLYDKEYFVIEKMKTVRATTTYLKTVFLVDFRTKQLNDERLLEVTRIA